MSAAQTAPGMTQIPIRTLGRLHDRIAELEAGARRYRWLRDRLAIEDVERLERDYLGTHDEAESIKCDAAVDAALRAATGEQS